MWTLPSVETTICQQPSPSVPISFAEIQQLQSQPSSNTTINAKGLRRQSLRDIQAEEAELQAEAEFMKWWTAEEERIRLENEAVAESLLQQPPIQQNKKQQQRSHHHHGRRNKKPVATAEGASDTAPGPGPRAPRGGDRKRKVT